MKKWIVIFLMFSLPGFSGKVYVSSERNGAKKVFITDNRTQAQMFVYFVKDQNEATKQYLWFKVTDRNNADMSIYYVTDKNQADLIIYLVKDKNSAGSARK